MLQHQHDFSGNADHSASLGDVLHGTAQLPRSLSSRERTRHGGIQMSRFWREKDDVIYLLTWSNGTSGQAWSRHLVQGGHPVMPDAGQMLRSKSFHPTNEIVRMVAILKGKYLVGRHKIPEVQRAFRAHPLVAPHPEVACLLRSQLTGQHLQAMGLSHIVVAHEPLPGHSHRLVLGQENLFVCNTNDPVDLGQQRPGIAFIASEHASPLSLAA